MPTAWLCHRSVFAILLFFPWAPRLLWSPPEVEPLAVAVKAGTVDEPQSVTPPPEQPLVLPGVVIEEIPKGSALEKAGLQVGDVILSWERLPNPPANPEVAEGVLKSYFNWMELEMEQVPRGAVVLRGRRGASSLELRVEPGHWEAKVRPVFSQALEKVYLAGKAQLAYGKAEAAVGEWRSLSQGGGKEELRAWVALRTGDAWVEKADWGKALEAHRNALETTEVPSVQLGAWQALGKDYERRNEYGAAQKAYSSALDILQDINPKSLGAAKVLNNLGEAAGDSGDLILAHKCFIRALEITEQLAPQSLLMARTLNNLGVEARLRGVLDRAEDLLHRSLAIRRRLAPLSADVAESLNNLGNIAEAKSEFRAAQEYLAEALKIRQKLSPGSLGEANSLNSMGVLLQRRGQLDLSYHYYRRSLQIREQLAPKSLELSTSLNNLGLVAKARGELDLAQIYFRRALEIRQLLAPKSLATAHVLNNLGEVASERGELVPAQEFIARALAICREVAPKSLDEATSLNNLGALAVARGDLTQANDYLLQAVQIQKLRAPHSLDLSLSLGNLGALNQGRGDLDRAYDYYLQALQIKEELAPDSLALASLLSNIGAVMRTRGELDRANDYHLRALHIQEKIAPNSLGMASNLNKLGILAQAQGNLTHAYDYYRRALSIYLRLSSKSLDVASTLNNLGALAYLQGKPAKAREYHLRALGIKEKVIPQSLSVSISLSNLGKLAYSRGELKRSRDYYSRALKITELLAYQSLDHIVCLYGLGLVAQANQEISRASDYFALAIDALEHQVSKLGGSYDVKAGFRVQRAKYYHDMIDVLVIQGRLPEAFHVLERRRAQTFLTMLAERDIAFTADIPEELDRERSQLKVLYDRTMKKLSGLSLRDNGEKIEASRKELQKLDSQAGDIEARIRQAAPQLAALEYPRPLDVAQAQQVLEPGTLLLSYDVGKEKTLLFTLSRLGDLEVKNLPVGEEALRSQVEQLRGLIPEARGNSPLSEKRRMKLEALSHELYMTLLEPVANRIATSERLLIIPDGMLHFLPFGALILDTEKGPQYLAAWKPLHVTLSATVFAELKQRRHPASESKPPQQSIQLVAFGDPNYPQNFTVLKDTAAETLGTKGASEVNRGDPTVRGTAERGLFDFQPLPYSRQEVLAIASLFPEGTTRTLLGPDAVEERIKSLDPKTRILHLAAHGSIDEQIPSGSFIALTIPEDTATAHTDPQRDNGLLQVWEIFEQVRLDADLVVLSACDTGLGKELGGEGLIGLTRAFQYAGARTVVASLWSVQDQATSELMIRFYKHLRAGLPKDEALRQAQMELIRGPIEVVNEKGDKTLLDASAPYYWAEFQLYGDWQ